MNRNAHFSMIRSFHVADLLTLGNGFCGVGAILQAVAFAGDHDPRRPFLAFALIAVALMFDFLDGRVARFRHEASPLGQQMDSLADLISFGVAPAALSSALGLTTALDTVVLVFFAGCGLARLARYNVTASQIADRGGQVTYFEGTPITTSFVPLVATIAAWHAGRLPVVAAGSPFALHAIALVYVLSGCLMISKTLRIPKL